MPSTLTTKIFFVFVALCFSLVVSSQDEEQEDDIDIEINEQDFTRQRFASFNLGYNAPITTGENFMGDGLKGRGGMNFRFHLYPYKQFFVGVGLGQNYFKVKNKALVGNYQKTTLTEQYLYVGYEFLPAEKMRLGVSASLIGDAQFKNKYNLQSDNVSQTDHGRLASYGLYFNYEIGGNFMVFIDYSYKTSKTKINVPTELQSTFNRGTYHNIGFGLVFVMGTNDFLSRFLD
ncbi:outer membrane beta-barrel protein [Winogradskyella sp. A3E31]|uniref:outer membrane beta-barrel protein n=1 Tax=Winogradskyella sp. A3E31 TaxID=3349637 RepID=UPI00398AFADC